MSNTRNVYLKALQTASNNIASPARVDPDKVALRKIEDDFPTLFGIGRGVEKESTPDEIMGLFLGLNNGYSSMRRFIEVPFASTDAPDLDYIESTDSWLSEDEEFVQELENELPNLKRKTMDAWQRGYRLGIAVLYRWVTENISDNEGLNVESIEAEPETPEVLTGPEYNEDAEIEPEPTPQYTPAYEGPVIPFSRHAAPKPPTPAPGHKMLTLTVHEVPGGLRGILEEMTVVNGAPDPATVYRQEISFALPPGNKGALALVVKTIEDYQFRVDR